MSTQTTQNSLRESDPDPITGEPGRERGGQGAEGTRDINPDPLTGQPGSHPVETAIGSAGAALMGAALGALGGPVGAVVGGVVGAVAGGLGGSAAGEALNPTAEDAYWRAHHSKQPYALPDDVYEDYRPAYRVAYEGYSSLASSMRTFEEAEAILRRQYSESSPTLEWEKGRAAARAAWERLSSRERDLAALDTQPSTIQSTAPQAAEVPMSTPWPRS